MSAWTERDELALMLARHAELEDRHNDGDGGRFISGWQCENPWAANIRAVVEEEAKSLKADDYLYPDLDEELSDAISSFHREIDGTMPSAILCAAGSSPLILSFCAWLSETGCREVFYMPPLYYSAHLSLRLLGFRARPISGRHSFEPDFTFNLPDQKSVLILTDPVWYAGIPLSHETISAIAEWQTRTGSFVFVDGSFQNARWDGRYGECSVQLDPDFTIRLICPTKALAIHGYRFAYALIPDRIRARLAHIYSSLSGSASLDNYAFARAIPKLMLEGSISRDLMRYVSMRHRALRSRGRIWAPWQAACGYFVFEKISARGDSWQSPLMDGSFFEQKRYPDYFRINLLSPSLDMLG
jgi:aspartate/methionine/tyrosine aminotransferase